MSIRDETIEGTVKRDLTIFRVGTWLTGSPMRFLAVFMWASCIAAIISSHPFFLATATACLAGYILLSAMMLRRWTWMLLAGGACILIASLALGASFDQTFVSLSQASRVGAFIFSQLFLRAVFEEHPSIHGIRQSFSQIAPKDRDGGMMLCGHLLGAVLIIGVMSILAPTMRNADEQTRVQAASYSMRGLSFMCVWSPFTVGIATATAILPQVPFWQIITLGLGVSLLVFALTVVTGEITLTWRSLSTVTHALSPVAFQLIGLAALTLIASSLFGLRAIDACILVSTCFSILWALAIGRSETQRALRAQWSRLNSMSDEFSLFALSTVLAGVVLSIPSVAAMLDNGGEQVRLPYFWYVAALATVALTPMTGIHMMLPATLVMTAFANYGAPSNIDGAMFIAMTLTGWSFASMSSPASVAMRSTSKMFGILNQSLMAGRNLRFFIKLSIILCMLMWVLYALSSPA